jgi:ABC-2 type transport system permease protein
MKKFVQNIRIFFSYSWYAYRALFTWLTPGTYLILKILGPITQVLFFTLLGRATGGDPAYYIIGNSTQLAVTSGVFGVLHVIVTERRMGTLPQLMMVPTSNAVTFYGRSLFLIFDGLTSIAVGFAVGAMLFGLDFSNVNWLWLIAALLTTCFAVSGLGLTLGVIGLVGTDLNLLLNVALSAFLVICGVNFPVEELPRFLQSIAHLLPLTHGLVAVRATFAGQIAGVPGYIGWEAIIGCGYMVLGYAMFTYFERLARKQGTLELQ